MSLPIPAGYSLSITSWENDADFFKTQVFHGLNKIDVQFLVDLAKLFKSMNNSRDPGLGSASWHYKGGVEAWMNAVMDAYDEVCAKYADKDLTWDVKTKWFITRDPDEDDLDMLFDPYNDAIADLVGYPEEEMYQAEGYIRVFDSFTVHYHPGPVADVTGEFQ